MRAGLREACGGRRFVFVVGKGGVGKTTTAGALAVDLAEAGETVHLISTDPAHSIGDLFGTGAHWPCGPQLCLEKFDAAAYAEQWAQRARPALAELIAHGTWLDDAAVAAVLDVSLPGIDEVMAAFRLVELAGGAARVVVDTAPTGHTLRLLEAGEVIETWIEPLRAMAVKAGVVASHVTGVPARLAAERFLDEQAAIIRRYRRDVLGDAAFLVVVRGEAAVRAETDRLLAVLAERSLPVAAIVSIGSETHRPGFANIVIPQVGSIPSDDPCGALLLLARGQAGPPHVADRTGAMAPRVAPADAWHIVAGRTTLLVAGKGGVGKSTCAAALAAGLAVHSPVLIVSTDPAGSLSDVLGAPVRGERTAIAAGLTARQIDAAAELSELRELYRSDVRAVFERIGLDAAASLDRNVVESLWNLAPPGMDELVAMIELAAMEESGETVVVDAAPTGHFLRLLEMPELARGWTAALMRLLLRHGAAASLDEVTDGVLGFSRRLRRLTARLTDAERTGAVVVTLDEPMVRAETERLLSALDAADIAVAAIVVNRTNDGASAVWQAIAGGVPVLAAPELPVAPAGADSMRDFLDRWERVA